jgi:hypothetical protein
MKRPSLTAKIGKRRKTEFDRIGSGGEREREREGERVR